MGRLRDMIEQWEDCAERMIADMSEPYGKLRCGCGRVFDPDGEGGVVSSNPWAMPVCGKCFEEWVESSKRAERGPEDIHQFDDLE